MSEVFINVKGLEIEELFGTDIVTVEDLVSKLIDMNIENNMLNEENTDLKEYKEQYCDKYSYD